MSMKRCPDCGTRFHVEAGEGWKKLCLDCWRESKRKSAGPTTYSGDSFSGIDPRVHQAALAERDRLRGQVFILEARLRLASSQPPHTTVFDHADLLALRRLCHPDRHGGSEAATRMSQKINQAISREAS